MRSRKFADDEDDSLQQTLGLIQDRFRVSTVYQGNKL